MIKQLLLHGATLYPISTDVSDDEHCSNLGIAYYNNKLVVNIRTITYIPRLWSLFDHKSENYIGYAKGQGHIDTKILPWSDGGYKIWSIYRGREDMRLVVWNNKLYGYATRTDLQDGKGCIEIIEFDDDLNIIRSIIVDNIIDVEKNWMAVPDKPFTFVWWNNPVTLVTIDPKTGHITQTTKDINLGNVSGSSQLMKYKGKYIGIVHKGTDLGYQEAFVTYSKDFSKGEIGEWFKMNADGFTEFITGLIYTDDYIYLAMTINDVVPIILQIPVAIFDKWYSGKLDISDREIQTGDSIIYNYIDTLDYKRALELLSIKQDIKFFTLFLWMQINNRNGFFPENRVLDNCINRINDFGDSADKYYLLSIIYSIFKEPHEKYLYKAKQLGLPSSFFSRFFNEHYIK